MWEEGEPMAMSEFLRSVQTARNMFFSQLISLDQSDPLPADRSSQDWKRLRTTAPVWLSPRVVAGFDSEEFGFLSVDQRAVLTEAVSKFRAIAEASAGREPTQDEMNRAIRYLIAIIGMLDEKLLDEEGKTLLIALTAATKPFPDFVLGIDYTLDTDATGDPGIWIWVIVPDDVDPDSSEFQQFSTRFRKAVRNALAEVKSERLPYVHFRLLSEAIEAMTEGVA
jgi:hypothetical protein